ncbi:MAG: tetratricopeptide repeat protein [Deltaproteobacteria bacterium]|nr:tetratricopeptide repeat protein [Deltaproteobacteria bacterium]
MATMAKAKGSVVGAQRQKAVRLLQGGHLQEAAALLEQVCARRPQDGEAWLLRSMIHGMRGEYDGVLACAGRAVALEPTNARAHSHLGSALAALGRRAESLAALERARALAPDDPGVLSNLANGLYLAERVEEAEPLFRRALACKPDHLESNYGLGHCLSAMGLQDEAIASYQRAAKINANHYEVMYGLGNACLLTGRLEQAEWCLQRALRLNREAVEVYSGLAMIDRVLGRFDLALAHLDDALAVAPNHFLARIEQADLYQRKGERERAYALLRGVLDQEVITPSLVMTYALICRYVGDCAEVVELGERLLAQEGLGRGDRATVHFALGGVVNGMGRFDAAFDHYRQANDLTPHRFDRQAHTAEIDGLIHGYRRAALPGLARARNLSERPIFILGMPRSGTSLVEQIVASHPRVYGAGELADVTGMAGLLSARLGGPYYAHLDALTPALVDELAEAHLQRLAERSGGAARTTDKMPHNFLKLGLITQLFPGARVIHCTRDPRDTCLSIYFQQFNRTHTYSWELGDIAHFYNEYRRLMRHWEATLEIAMIEVNYERLVGDLAGETRRMVEFLGLDWDERCLRFYETERPVATASFDQVRQPLYTGSVGRWRNYERHLGPLLEGLGLAGGAGE